MRNLRALGWMLSFIAGGWSLVRDVGVDDVVDAMTRALEEDGIDFFRCAGALLWSLSYYHVTYWFVQHDLSVLFLSI